MTYPPEPQPPTPPWTPAPTPYPRPGKKPRAGLVIAVITAAVLVLAGAGVALYGAVGNAGPLKDPGVVGCESMRDKATKKAATGVNEKFTAVEYHAVRKMFAGSRYPDLRDAGTRLVDLIWQASQATGDSATGMALALGGQLIGSYASFVGACANHGVTVPALGS